METENISDYCKDYICDRIHDHVGRVLYTCDIAQVITMSANIDGSITYDAAEAAEYLKSWWHACAEFECYCADNFGKRCEWSPFADSEAYMVCMVIAGVESLLSQCDIITQQTAKLKITSEIANKIIAEIKDKNVIF